MEAFLAWFFLGVTVYTQSPYWAMVSGLFAVACNLNLIYKRGVNNG